MLCVSRLSLMVLELCESIPCKDLILFVIAQLNHCYNVFVCYIIGQASSITVEKFHNQLLVFEYCLHQQGKDEEHQIFQANLVKISAMNVGGFGDHQSIIAKPGAQEKQLSL